MGFQSSVTDIKEAYAGDVSGALFYPTQGATVRDLVTVGKFCWVDATDAQFVNKVKGTNTQLSGLVYRDNATVWNNADYSIGYSMDVSSGYACQVAQRGSYYAVLFASLAAAQAVNLGDAVYCENATGNVVVGVTAQGGYTKTNFVITQVGAVGELVIISNTSGVNA